MKNNTTKLCIIIKKEKRKRRNRKIAFTMIALFMVYRLIFSLILIASDISVTAHRGSTNFVPENTVASVLEAIALNADFAEIDVQLTKDGEVILLHDANFKRVAGHAARPSTLSYEEIQKFNVGAYMTDAIEFHAPLLKDVIEVCMLSSMKLNIELKDYGHNASLPYKVASIIKEYDFEDRCVVSSYSAKFLKTMKILCPEVKVGLITNSTSLVTYVKNDFVDFFSVNYVSLSPSIVMYVHFRQKEVYCWTPSNRRTIEAAIRTGADNIITNNVALTQLLIVSTQ